MNAQSLWAYSGIHVKLASKHGVTEASLLKYRWFKMVRYVYSK